MIQVADSTETALFRRQAAAINGALLISAARQHELADEARSLGERMQAAVRARDRFLAVLSHELRNPLTALNTGLHLLDLDAGGPAKEEQSTATRAMMGRQLGQMVRLVDDLLDVSRITTGKLILHKERVDLASVLRDAVEASRPLIDGGGHRLTLVMPGEPITLDADPTRLTQVFLNLLSNAARYSERGGHIWLTAGRDGDVAVVSIRDLGIGIAASQLAHVFDAFVQLDTSWRRTQGGMGIGLSLVQEFVGLHGGTVEAHSEGPGMGSEFIVRLPAINKRDDERTVSSAAIEEPIGPGRRILVVDDNSDAAEALARYLRIFGHEVQSAHDSECRA